MIEFKDKWIICPAWPYVHQVPHLGNLLCILAADAFARFFNSIGDQVALVSGSDEHGARIEFEADRQGITPKELVDRNHQKVLETLKYFRIDFDRFGKYSRTTAEHHKKFVQDFFQKIYENNYTLTKVEKLPYCPDCKRFLPDRFVEGTCPNCGFEDAKGNQCEQCLKILDPVDLIEPKCAVCGTKPVFKKTKHWYLDLPKLSGKLKKWIKKQDQWSKKAKSLALSWIEEGLKPRAITRDIEFGIPAPFPESEKKTLYCWAEAVLGYISATKQWAKEKGNPKLFDKLWKDHETRLLFTHGKDNLPFHTILFPALVIASGEDYVLPDQIFSNEYIKFEGKSFSKSRGIGIWLDEAIQLLDNPDYWRYYLFAIFPEKKDTDFEWADFESKINDELIANFANFIHRALSFLHQNFGGEVPEPKGLRKEDKNVIEKIKETVKKEKGLINSFKLKEGLKKAIRLSIIGNEYFQHQRPWKTVESDPEKCSKTLYVSVNLCKTLAILVGPYLPYTAEKIWKMLNLKGAVHQTSWKEAAKLTIKPGHQVNRPKILFEKVKKEELKKKLEEVRKDKMTEKIKIQDFEEVDLRVGKILEAEPVEGADKLFKLKVDIGTKTVQTIAGIAEHYSLDELKGKQVVMVTNLEPATIRGVRSEGMVLAAVGKEKIRLVAPDEEIKVGTKVR